LLLRLPRFPGSLGPSCLLGASNTNALPLVGLALQAFQTLLVTHAGLLGLGVLLLYGADLAFACTEVLHQRNAARAHIGAGTALDAVEQVVALQLRIILAQGKPVQLLGQQLGRAGLGAQTA